MSHWPAVLALSQECGFEFYLPIELSEGRCDLSIALWNDVELIKEQLTKMQQNLSASIQVADVAQLIRDIKDLTDRVAKLEKKVR